uniref:COPI coat complex subunit gamma 1 n=1 Tax=Microcebus murinus TaxID=30608 RepID=A0A8C6EJW8_MICMU
SPQARVFNETPINPRKCAHILTKILYLINQGEHLGTTEATEAFFAMTKLFQSNDVSEMSCIAEDVIIVTSSLTKDMTGKEDNYRGPAVRALCQITDVTSAPGLYSRLFSWTLLLACAPSLYSRLFSQPLFLASTPGLFSQPLLRYHALGLLYHVRRNDRLAVSKMISKFTRHGLKSPFAYCMMIRVASKQLEEEDRSQDSPLFDFVESCLRSKHEMVVYEAASAIVNLPGCSAKELAPAVSVLQLFCSSPKAALRYAAVRTLNKVRAQRWGRLGREAGRPTASPGSEAGPFRLLAPVASLLLEVVVVQAISALCQKYPRKHAVLMNFLFTMLREEVRVRGVWGRRRASPVPGMEDRSRLRLGVGGQPEPKSETPARSGWGRPRVRVPLSFLHAGAVSALAKFGAQNEEMLPSILVLLKRCVMDDDNEVRDRATFYLNVLEQRQKALNRLTVSHPGPQYTLEPSDKPFDLKSVPLATAPTTEQRAENAPIAAVKQPEKVAATRQEIFQEQLAAVPEFRGLGPLFKSSPEPVALTESETEYVIRCTKHTFPEHMVFQFDCTNTLNDQTLEDVTVHMEPTEAYQVLCQVPARSLPYNQPGTCYTLVALPRDDPTAGEAPVGAEALGGELEDLEVTVVMKMNFEAVWDEVGDEVSERRRTFTLCPRMERPR